MVRRGGRAGLRGGKPSQSHYPCTRWTLLLRAGIRGPLHGRAVRGAPRTLFLGLPTPCLACCTPPAAWRWLLLRWPGRGLPQQTCHPTPRKRAAPSWVLFVPPPGSALGRRLLPRRAVEVRGAALSPARRRPRFRPSGPLRTKALYALFLPGGLRAELGGGGAPSPEPAQVSVWGGAGWSQSRAAWGRWRRAPRGEPCWNRSCGRAAGQAGSAARGRPSGMTRQCSLPAEAPTRLRDPGPPGGNRCPALCPSPNRRAASVLSIVLGEVRIARALAPPWGIDRGSRRRFAALVGSGGSAGLRGGRRLGLGSSCSKAS